MTDVRNRKAPVRERGRAHTRRPSRAPSRTGGRRRRITAYGHPTVVSVLLAGVGVALIVLGLVMTFSASFVSSAVETGDPSGTFLRQLTWAGIGTPLMLVAACTDYRRWRSFAFPVLALVLVACVLVLVPGIGTRVAGARRWFDFGPVQVQPSEILKLALPLALAALVAERWDDVRTGDLRTLLVPALPLLAFAVVLVGVEDLETALLVGAIGMTVLWVAGLPTRLVAVSGLIVAPFVVQAIVSSGFRSGRIAAWLHPASDPGLFGYQGHQGLLSLGSGGLLGVGLGASRGKWLYVPNAHTDFIFAIIGEELGLVGSLLVLLLYAVVAICGVLAATRARDHFGRLLAAAITAWLLLQAAINIGSVVGLFPITGVTLPLVSFGGSSLVVTMVGVGLLIAIARTPAGLTKGRGR